MIAQNLEVVAVRVKSIVFLGTAPETSYFGEESTNEVYRVTAEVEFDGGDHLTFYEVLVQKNPASGSWGVSLTSTDSMISKAKEAGINYRSLGTAYRLIAQQTEELVGAGNFAKKGVRKEKRN